MAPLACAEAMGRLRIDGSTYGHPADRNDLAIAARGEHTVTITESLGRLSPHTLDKLSFRVMMVNVNSNATRVVVISNPDRDEGFNNATRNGALRAAARGVV